MKLGIFLMVGVLSACCAGRQKVTQDPPKYDAVVKVATHDFNCVNLPTLEMTKLCLSMVGTEDPGGPAGGTAFWVSEHYIITAQHVALYADADPQSALILTERDGQNEPTSYARIKVDRWAYPDLPETDFAVGFIENPPDHAILQLCSDAFEGEAVTAIGYPIETGYEIANGNLIGYYKVDMIASSEARPGYSGGPTVSDVRGCVVGVTYAAGPGFSLMIPYFVLVNYLTDLYRATTPLSTDGS